MKLIKIVLGTIFGLATVCYVVLFLQTLVRFVRVWVTWGYSAQGLSETGSALVAVCIGVFFTKWTLGSAFRKRAPPQEEDEQNGKTPNG